MEHLWTPVSCTTSQALGKRDLGCEKNRDEEIVNFAKVATTSNCRKHSMASYHPTMQVVHLLLCKCGPLKCRLPQNRPH